MIVGVTGHRDLKHPLDEVIETFGWFLQTLKPKLVITGMAIGFDQAVVLACLKHDFPYEAAVPCDGQERLWPEEAQVGYQEMLSQAEKVTNVSPGKYAAWKMHARNGYIIKKCDLLIAYCHPSTTQGGTFQAIKLAQSTKGKQIINMFDYVGKPLELERVFQAALSRPSKTSL